MPIVEGSDRTGVLGSDCAEGDRRCHRACEELGTLRRLSDRHSGPFHGSLQPSPPPAIAVAGRQHAVGPAATFGAQDPADDRGGLLEPAYDVGGDCFDYALNGTVFDMAVFDPMGHGVAGGADRFPVRWAPTAMIGARAIAQTNPRQSRGGPRHQFQGAVFATGLLAANRPRHGRDDLDECWASAAHSHPWGNGTRRTPLFPHRSMGSGHDHRYRRRSAHVRPRRLSPATASSSIPMAWWKPTCPGKRSSAWTASWTSPLNTPRPT